MVCAMLGILAFVLVVCQWSPRTAYRVLQHSQHLFEAEEQAALPQLAARNTRPYITPLVKKRVAARQGWRCASCKALLDETFEIDHATPLFRGGTNNERNLQALCKRCHAMKSAVEQSKI
jgi:5-methylcytosine-specific restriction endonuclease McrA